MELKIWEIIRTSVWDLCWDATQGSSEERVSCTYRTANERQSVTDEAMRPERGGATSLAGGQATRHKFQIGVHGARETPVPIPNTAVKPSSGYNTWVLALGK